VNYPHILSFKELPLYPVIQWTTPVSCHSMNYPCILSFDELPLYPVIWWTTPVSCHSLNYPHILSFNELPLYAVIQWTTPISCHSLNLSTDWLLSVTSLIVCLFFIVFAWCVCLFPLTSLLSNCCFYNRFYGPTGLICMYVFNELPPYPVIHWTTPVSCHSMNYPLVSRKKFHLLQRASQARRSTEGDRV
jgi:hypothetical protein